MTLFKYLPPEREEIFSQLSLRLTPPDQLNDPLDCVASMTMPKDLPVLQALFEEETRRMFLEQTGKQPVGSSFDAFRSSCLEARERWIDWALSDLDDHSNLNAGKKLQALLSQLAGVLCFSENADNTLMWSHYAQDHKGYVVGLDSTHHAFHTVSLEPGRPGTLTKVIYSDRRHRIGHTLDDADFGDVSYLFIKSLDWTYEAEWRLILPLTFGRKVGSVVVYDFPPEAIREVIIGYRASPELRQKITALKEKHPLIQVKQARPSSVTFQMILEKMD